MKDLAKAVAQQCVVLNCSDAMNYRAMAKIFKGLCCSGAWACFDEFNRIDLEVLSVIAQQVSSMQRAIAERKATFIFEGQNIPLVHTACSFITMNPGYAGRSELPDNLKALFRSVAMMIPDYAMIAEIVLYSYGYSEARLLARKLVACLRLSSEQLSSQDHYDFGMRNVKSILSAAGRLKGERPDASEEWLTVESIKNCNEPKFVSEDIPLFHGIVKDLFPSIELSTSPSPQLLDALKERLVGAQLQAPPAFVHKCVELYDTVLVRHGIMMVGRPFSGKSTAIRAVADSLTALSGAGVAGFQPVDVAYINPKAVTVDELYGAENAAGEWVQGVVPIVMADMVRDWQSDRRWKWIVFDGPVDAVWIENMNTVLDDNKKLCLASGEQIKLAPHMSVMFEVEDLAQASPATVSRCGMVYMEQVGLGVQALVESWIQRMPAPLSPYLEQLHTLCAWLLPPTLAYVAAQSRMQLQVSEMHCVSSFTHLMDALLADLVAALQKPQASPTSEQAVAWVEGLVLFSLVWSVGSHGDVASRARFHSFFHDLTRGRCDEAEHGVAVAKDHVHRKASNPIPQPDPSSSPPTPTVFDFAYAAETQSWRPWLRDGDEFVIPAQARFTDIVVPTVDTVRNDYLLQLLLTAGRHLLMVGSTGTGKTITAQAKLLHGLDRGVFIPLFLAFSARTTAATTQELIDSKLERRRVGVMARPLASAASSSSTTSTCRPRTRTGRSRPSSCYASGWIMGGGMRRRRRRSAPSLTVSCWPPWGRRVGGATPSATG